MRVVYREDLDGIVCAAILLDLGIVDELRPAHHAELHANKVHITKQDIICNLPYHPKCNMWFDHHSSELNGAQKPEGIKGLFDVANSAARLVYKYYLPEHPELKKYSQLVYDTDRVDSADLTLEQVENPQGIILLGFLTDPRTGLDLNGDFSIPHDQWLKQLPGLLTKHTVEEIMELPDTVERVSKYQAMQTQAAEFYAANSRLDENVIITDVRGKNVPTANRFLIYTLPGLKEGNISVRVADGKSGTFHSISVAHSIFVHTSFLDCGALCKQYGGGGHRGAATCRPSPEDSDRVLKEIIEACRG